MCNYLTKMYKTETSELWKPCENLMSKYKNHNYAVVILNRPISFLPAFMMSLWNQAKVRVTVDGGTDRWLAWLKQNELNLEDIVPPDLVTGDMDSISKEILHYFIKQNLSRIVKTPNQNETDFTKALRELSKFCNTQHIDVEVVYVIADTSGRFDQILANINTLYKATSILTHTKVIQVGSNSLTWLLPEGAHHVISIPRPLRDSQEWCALIPIGSYCYATTKGLKWDLDNRKLEFGMLVSTSNTYGGSSTVTIENDTPLVWSMGIKSLLVPL